jgi:hypothetical protein
MNKLHDILVDYSSKAFYIREVLYNHQFDVSSHLICLPDWAYYAGVLVKPAQHSPIWIDPSWITPAKISEKTYIDLKTKKPYHLCYFPYYGQVNNKNFFPYSLWEEVNKI